MKTLKSSNWLMLLVAAILMLFAGQARAQAVDDLQEYLDRLAAEQAAQGPRQGPRKAASVEVPVGLTEVDLSKFTSYQNRTTGVTVKASVKFTNGTITAASTYAGGTCLLKVYDGATVVLGETAGVDASAASTANCIGAVGIYGGSTFYQCGDITAPASCTGHAIWMETAADTYYYVSGSTCGDIYNPNSGTVVGVDDSSSLTPGEYVDLGLPSGTLWATHNIGATNPEDYGDYFAWGETTTKSTYTESNYTYSANPTELPTSADAAYVNWGSQWRMPSLDQFSELINSSYTTSTWTTVNGVNGYKITSKTNGNCIFLPAAGAYEGDYFMAEGLAGFYMSRTLKSDEPSRCRLLDFIDTDSPPETDYSVDRYGGYSVRPVRSSILLVESITLMPATLALTEGATSQLTATVTPSGATNPALTWSSSDTNIATVSSTGLVTAVAPGTAVITCAATDGSGVKATCQVTVTPVPTDPASLTSGEYVDLGLPSGTLWATHNIGATNPEDYGDYFAWGETTTKSTYDWSTYKYCNGSGTTMTKYCTSSNYGTVDNKTELELSDDAAYVNWGSNWRMPSNDQLEELINSSYTTTTWTTVNGVYGRKITSKSNGNSIFLPAAGSRGSTSLYSAGSYGDYWSRTLYTSYPGSARYLGFGSSFIDMGYHSRGNGQNVRPVRSSILLVENITLTPATLALTEGATSQLTATVTPSGATNPALTWSSSDTNIATVSSTGLVTAVSTGTAVITCAATDGSGVKATCQVTVTQTYAQLKAKLDAIQTELDGLYTRYNQAKTLYESVYGYLTEAQQTEVETKMGQVKEALDALQARKTALATQLESAATSAYPALNTQIETLAGDVADFKSSLIAELNSRTEEIKAILATKLQGLLTTLGNDVAGMQNSLNSLQARRAALAAQVGEGYFLYKPTAAFAAQLDELDTQLGGAATAVQTLIAHYNALVSGTTISTIQEAVAALQQYENVASEKDAAGTSLADCTSLMTAAETAMEALEMTFPDESLAWTLRPTGLTEERQLGYKSNRGFVITSAGMMWFERKEGADFNLRDAENNYIVATSGQQTLTTGTKAEATVWTGRNLLNGSYTIQGKAVGAHLGYGGVKVNSPIIADPNNAYAWTITESTLDDLQAFLNLLAEEEEVENSGEGTLTETDTLVVHVPVVTCDCNHNPFVFPIVPYPIIWRGAPGPRVIPLPRPVSGNPGEDFHPIHIPDGSHVILDEVDFNDIVGGHHVIYVDGVLEINVTVNIYVINWDWFIKVGPHGRVIWRPRPGTGCWPRIWNEGTMDMEEGEAGYVDNRGTVNHRDGTIGQVVNRRIYHFTGGIVNDCRNYGEYNHSGGNVLTAHNFEDGTYNMTGGSIGNTVVVNVTDTVFVNCGRFYFRGGWLRGYGSRLIWHKRGAYMWLDGGQFDVTHIHDYFIEAHDEFYIRGDYNVSLPMLLEPTVIVRILYKWTYKFNIVFIGGRPRPRYPLFWGYDFTLGSDFYKYIGWDLPNRRWRWYYKSEDNTIEPRDEEVYDEDDLQAYLDWLAENQDGESASTEAAPQELDLGGRDIVITQPVVLPVGCHVFIRNGRFVPGTGWTAERMFYIPSGCSMRYEHVVFDFSSSTYYLVGGIPRHRYIFDIVGHVRFGTGCRVIGYYDFGYTATDDYLPGAAFRIDPSARLYLDGAEFTNVVFRLNVNVNIYLTVGLLGKIWFYVPEAYRYTGFRLIGTDGGYGFSTGDLDNIGLVGLTGWGVETDEGGYGVLKDRTYVLPDLTLDESTDNTALLETYDGETTNVTLKRTLQPGGWNTFCVPFAMDAAMVADKLGTEAVVKQLDHSVLDGDILTLYFTDATAIEAGRAYLVSVVGTLADPVFEGVTVSKYPVVTETAYADFVPALSPVVLRSGDKKSLFVVGGNTLTFPSETSTLKSFRGYFHLHDVPAGVRLFNMDFENTWTGVEGLDGVQTADEWYTLDGRKLSGKPVQKGIYVKNGCKVMVK